MVRLEQSRLLFASSCHVPYSQMSCGLTPALTPRQATVATASTPKCYALAGPAGLRDAGRYVPALAEVRWAGCGFPSTSRRGYHTTARRGSMPDSGGVVAASQPAAGE